MESKTLDFTGMKIPRDYLLRKEEIAEGAIKEKYGFKKGI